MHSATLSKDYTKEPHEDVPCPLHPGGWDFVLARRGFPAQMPVRNVICTTCGLIRVNPRLTRAGYEAFYKEDFFAYLNPYERPAYVEEIEHTTDDSYMTPTKRFILPRLLDLMPQGGRLLDVGAGFGQISYLLKKERNATSVGLEPDPYSRKIAKEKMGIDLTDMTIEEYLTTDTGLFDLIVMDQVFEHLLTPLETLQELGKRLTPEGVIYVSVPNAYNPFISMKLFYQLAHTYNYTPATMRLFAERSGLKVVSIRDPLGYPLDAVLARKDSKRPEEKEENMVQGRSWIDTTLRLKRKGFLNVTRGAAKQVATALFGENGKERLKNAIDRLIGFKY